MSDNRQFGSMSPVAVVREEGEAGGQNIRLLLAADENQVGRQQPQVSKRPPEHGTSKETQGFAGIHHCSRGDAPNQAHPKRAFHRHSRSALPKLERGPRRTERIAPSGSTLG